MSRLSATRRLVRQIWPGVVGVPLLTAIFRLLHLNYATAGFLYLLLVLFQALRGSALAGVLVSIWAALCLDFFFVPPILNFRIADPVDAAAFVTYTATALVVAYMAAKARRETRVARRHQRELRLLFSSASRLLALEPEAAGAQCLKIFRDVFALRAVCLFDAEQGESRQAGESLHGLAEQTRDAYLQGRNADDPTRGISLRCLRVAGKTTGAMGLEGFALSTGVAGAISVLAAATCERVRHLERAIKAASEARAEVLRSAILDAFAHEFKTPLTAIMAAAGSLSETGPLNLEQSELANAIEDQAAWLGRLTTRLLQAARLDREEVRPRLEPTEVYAWVAGVISSRASLAEGDRLDLARGDTSFRVLADPELLTFSLIPVLDNALKYSRPGTGVIVSVEGLADWVAIRVKSRGNPILRPDRSRIFERFYRGALSSHAAPGTGLGLYISKKILLAHGGDIVLEDSSKSAGDVTFCLRLPLLRNETDHARRAS